MIGRAFYEKYGFEKIKEYLHEQTNNQIIRLQFKLYKIPGNGIN